MSEADLAVFEEFQSRNLIAEVLGPVKSGKEATVYGCRAPASSGAKYLAAKVYHPLAERAFRHDAVYQEGRWYWRRENRAVRAFRNKSEFGREVQAATWVGHEWATLNALWRAGVSVPRPRAVAGRAILMEFLGTPEEPAPQLRCAQIEPGQATAILDALLVDVERMLAARVVHGDLSPYNILWCRGRARIIDLPQAVDPRHNPCSERLLTRDLENVCGHFERYGVHRDAGVLARDLWRRFMLGEV